METLFIGRQRFEEPELESTNRFALDLLHRRELKEGAVVLTGNQTGGRGQQGKRWDSEPQKNLTISFVLMPAFLQVTEQFELARMASLAVAGLAAELLRDTNIPVRIKWPNDIYAGDKKIAGILIENVLRYQTIGASVIGIGLNVNQKIFVNLPQAASLGAIADKEFDLKYCEELLCQYLEAGYLNLKAGKSEKIDSDYRCQLYRLNEKHGYSSNGKEFQASISGVSRQGKLQLRSDHGTEMEYDLNQIRFII
jgi:BirA family biotin operon repressor/biotin-[acetyl-CoA-carboxylase] ligase